MSKPNATLLKLAAAVAQRQAQHAQAAQQQAQAAQAVTQDMVRQLAVDMVRELRDNAIPAIDKRDGAQLVREAFTIENMVRGVFEEIKHELRGADGKNVTADEAEALVRAVFAEIEPQLHGRDGDNATPDMVATAVADWLRAHPPAAGRNATPEQIAAAVAAYLAANPPKPGKDGQDATPDMVAAAVAKWLQANPPKAGPPGPAPQHEVKGRKIRWRQPDGSWGQWIELGGKSVIVGGGGAVPAPAPDAGTAYTVAVKGKNTSGATIAKGTPVMATGTLGASGIITIAPMDGTNPANAMYLIGVAGADIAVDAEGDVVDIGKVRGIDATAWAEGDVLWISPTAVGELTNTEPAAGQLKMPVAFVVTDHHQNGEIMVRVTPVDESRFQDALTWTDLATRWDAEPTLTGTATTPTAGDVYAYTLAGATRYRLVPAAYTPAADVFYTAYASGVCSGPIVARNQ